jgi:hypothetical protein
MDFKQIGAKAKKWTIRIGVWGIVILILGAFIYTYASLHFAYSAGERVGFVQKLSKKGWICKTNEGELAMVNMPGQEAQIFSFTVPDDSMIKKIESYSGHRVVLKYEEHRGIPSSCFGETPYFVVGVEETH